MLSLVLGNPFIGGAGAAASQSAGAQVAVRVPDAPSCPLCTIDARVDRVIGDTAGPGQVLGYPSSITADSRGRFWLTYGAELPKVYDARGRFVRNVGAKGGGPGEIARASDVIVLPGDSTLVIDIGNSRAAVVSPDLRVGRLIALPFFPRPSVVLHWPDTVWSNASLLTPNEVGYPLHWATFASSAAQILSSFGPDEHGDLRPGGFDAVWQWIASPRAGGVWTANSLSYRLTRWSRSGIKQLMLERAPDWFLTQSKAWMGNKTTPPPPVVSAIHEDTAGLVWVFVNVPSKNWKDAWTFVEEGVREVPASRIMMDKLYVTRVEVIDPAARRVVTSAVVDSWVTHVLEDGRIASQITDVDGHIRIQIMRLTLHQP